VDGEVLGAAFEIEEAETGPKDGQSGPSAWRHLAVDGEPAAAACAGGWEADVQVGERRGDQVKPSMQKGSPTAGGWGAASRSTRGVSRGERRGSKGIFPRIQVIILGITPL
jgi:hypothetical protein